MPHTQPSHSLERLEDRRLMDGTDDLPNVLYYPEGYTHAAINEFVPITNTNNAPVSFELLARYETGQRDQLIAAGTIPANTRGGVTINRSDDPLSRLVREDTPYALVLRSSLPVAASISHYDFGTAIGESFTDDRSTDWTFAEGYKDDAWTRDFIVLYNPNDTPTAVTLTAYTSSGEQITLTKVVETRRRSGWNLNAESAIPAGVFGVKVHGSQPIVAALSHYEIVTQRGFGALGTVGGGATAGVVTAIEFDDLDEDHHRNRGGDDNGGGGNGGGNDDGTPDQGGGNNDDPPGDDNGSSFPANAYLTVLNTSPQTATVTFTFIARDDLPLANPTRTISVAPGARGGLNIRDLGFPLDDEFGAVYRSDVPVTVTAAVYQGRDALGVEATTVAATQWTFGEGYMSRLRAGFAITEDVYLFNPSNQNVSVTVEFLFSTGQVISLSKHLSALEIEDVRVHDEDAILNLGPDVFFGIRITASAPITASMEHWDRDLGGGFATVGIPAGTIVPLASILAL
jgi:hypothetical protein